MKRPRSVLAASLGLLAARAAAQAPVSPPPGPIVPGMPNASQRTVPPSRSGALPKPQPQFSQQFKLIDAEETRREGRKLTLQGHVVFEYHGYRVLCDLVLADSKTDIFELRGHVYMTGADATIHADRIVVDYTNNSFQAFDSHEDLKPDLVGGQLRGDLYVKDLEAHGTQNLFFATAGAATTCDLPNPHFDLAANDVEIRYGVRAILRRAVLHILGAKIVTLPYIVIPLDDRTYNNLPLFGYDTDEGYYVKFRYGIPLSGNRDLLTHVDYMSYLGLGLGADYRYNEPRANGIISVYGIGGASNELSISNQHTQQFKGGATFTIQDDYENNNYLMDPGETTFNMRGSLSLPQGTKGNTLLSWSDSMTQSTGYTSSSETVGLTDDRRWTSALRTDVGLNYSGSSSTFSGATGGSTSSSQGDLNVKFQATDSTKRADLGLEYLRDVPIGSNANFTSGNDITPELSVTSDAGKLLSPKLALQYPFHTELTWGDFSNGINGGQPIGRTEFDFALQHPDLSKNKFTLNWNAEFKQTFYTDSTAEYIVNLGTDFRYTLNKDSYADLRYSYMRPYGYSPLTIDQVGITDLISVDTMYRVLPGFLTGFQTGYDIYQLQQMNEPWQPVGVRTEYSLGNYFSLRGLETYEPVENAWSSVMLDLTYKPGATLFAVGASFDGIEHTWTSLNITLANLKMGRINLSSILQYDGYTKQFDTQQYNVVYDMTDCTEAVFSMLTQTEGFRPGNQFQFFIRLKALPFNGNFGLGTRGQSITSNTGIGY